MSPKRDTIFGVCAPIICPLSGVAALKRLGVAPSLLICFRLLKREGVAPNPPPIPPGVAPPWLTSQRFLLGVTPKPDPPAPASPPGRLGVSHFCDPVAFEPATVSLWIEDETTMRLEPIRPIADAPDLSRDIAGFYPGMCLPCWALSSVSHSEAVSALLAICCALTPPCVVIFTVWRGLPAAAISCSTFYRFICVTSCRFPCS